VPPGTLASDDRPVIVDESDEDIKGVCTCTDMSKVGEYGSTFLDDVGILPVDHDEGCMFRELEGVRVLATAGERAVAGSG
jgi:hypothetical protein